jgi:hypothetical protein
MSPRDSEKRLDRFIDKYSPEIAAEAREALAKMRARLPGSIEMVYDNYNALVIGFGPTDRPAAAIFSLAVYPRWITLFFLQGTGVRDPHRRLKGNGKQVRQLRLESAETLDDPVVDALIAAALESAAIPIDPETPRQLIIKSVSEKQRPRRPGKR